MHLALCVHLNDVGSSELPKCLVFQTLASDFHKKLSDILSQLITYCLPRQNLCEMKCIHE